MKKRPVIIASAVALLSISVLLATRGTVSYLVDAEKADNIVTIGKVDVEISEGDYEDEQIIPAGGIVKKAPQLKNNGYNDEYVFFEVAVPKKNVTLLYESDVEDTNNPGTILHKEGTKLDGYTSPKAAEIFKMIADGGNKDTVPLPSGSVEYEYIFGYNKGDDSHDGWVYLSKNDSGSDYNYYYFGYNKRLEAGNSTVTLFDKVQLKSFIDLEIADKSDTEDVNEAEMKVEVKAYGIQSDDLGIEGITNGFTGRLDQLQLTTLLNIVRNKGLTNT